MATGQLSCMTGVAVNTSQAKPTIVTTRRSQLIGVIIVSSFDALEFHVEYPLILADDQPQQEEAAEHQH